MVDDIQRRRGRREEQEYINECLRLGRFPKLGGSPDKTMSKSRLKQVIARLN